MHHNTEVLFEDKHIIVCHKEAGMPVQTNRSSTVDLVSYLKNRRIDHCEPPNIFLVHRLDQPVEGIIVCAKTKKAAADLSIQLSNNRIDKNYLAIVEFEMKSKSGILEHYLKKDVKANTSMVVTKETEGAKYARLFYKVLKFDGKRSLIDIKLDTGRHHQIRVQLADIGHPLYGDKKYNKNHEQGYTPIALCSYKLKLLHPKTKEEIEFISYPKGEVFQSFRIAF